MVVRLVTILMVAVAAVVSPVSVRGQLTVAFDVGQLDDQGEGKRDPATVQIAQQAVNLIQQRAAALKLALPALALRGDPHSRHFEAHLPNQSVLTVENQDWRSHLTTAEDGAVELDLPTAFRLAVIHSDAYQSQVESLLLAAIQALATNRDTVNGSFALKGDMTIQDSVDAEIRSFCDFRQKFLATVAAGDTRRLLSSRTVYPPTEFGTTTLGGYLGLVEQQHWIELTKDLLAEHSRVLASFEAYHEQGLIGSINVDVYRQGLEQQRAELDSAESAFEDAVDSFKIKILGLPSGLPVRVKPSLNSLFQLTGPLTKQLAERITFVKEELATVDSKDDEKIIQHMQRDLTDLLDQAELLVAGMEKELQQFEPLAAARARNMTDADSEKLQKAQVNLRDELTELQRRMTSLREGLFQLRRLSTVVEWAARLRRAVRQCAFVQARIRLEIPCIVPVDFEFKKTFRSIQQADPELRKKQEQVMAARQEVVQMPDDNDQATRAARMVRYQRIRRELMLCSDTIEADLRNTFCTLSRLETSLEIQRRAVAIAIRRIVLTSENLSAPRPPAAPGELPGMFGDTSAADLFTALTDFRTTQCNLMNVWRAHYAVQLRLYGDVGAIKIDEDGNWSVENN